jgi:hypothetical protein
VAVNPRLGKKPAQPARRQLLLSPHMINLPAPPASVDYGLEARGAQYPMYGNDQLGDCVEAGIGHQIGQYTLHATGTEALFTTDQIVGEYSAITGYNPADPNSDQGTYTQDAMTYWRKSGFVGHQIVAFASLALTNLTQVMQAIELFGAIGLGFNFPESAMDQFNAGRPWEVVPGSSLEGGHYVHVLGYDVNHLNTRTWGAKQLMTWAFYQAYADEAWVVITPEMADAAGSNTFSGIDLYGLGQDFAQLTGQANPIPRPTTGHAPAQ